MKLFISTLQLLWRRVWPSGKHVKLWIWKSGIQASPVTLACEQALQGTLVAGWEKEGELQLH